MAVVAGGALVALVAVSWLLLRAHAQETAHWALERRELLNRIQRPEQIPLPSASEFVFPEPEPDEINRVGTIEYQPEEAV
jgi:hypothetical protein